MNRSGEAPTHRPFHRRKVHPPLKDLGLAILLLELDSPSTFFVLLSIPCLVLALASRDASRRDSGRSEGLAGLARILAGQTQDERVPTCRGEEDVRGG
jgi:hypothetical protein